MNIQVDPKHLKISPALRKKVRELQRISREVRMCLTYDELLNEGDGRGEAIRNLARRFSASESTVKRAIRHHSRPPWKKRR